MNRIRILITGANGQLGNEIRSLSDKYKDFDFLFSDVDTLDITDIEALKIFFKSNPNINYIINCAAYTNVDKAESEPDKAYKINVDAVANLKQMADMFNTKLIHISTDYVFDASIQNYVFGENDTPNARSVYGLSKLKGEETLAESRNALIIRTSWLYSTYGHNFVKTMIKLGKEREQINVVFDQIGTPCYAADLAKAILDILLYTEKNQKFACGIYHFSNEGVCSWYDFATAIMKISKLNCKVNPIETKDYPTPASRPYFSVLNKFKIKNTFNIEIRHWEESLRECINSLNP